MVKAWCLAGISVVFLVMLLGSSYKHSIAQQTWLLREAEMLEMLQDQIPKMKAHMADLQATHAKMESKRAELLGLASGVDPIYFVEDE